MKRSKKTPDPLPARITDVCRRLRKAYGPVEPPPEEPVLDELVRTILSQNTSDTNSGRAFESLKRRFPTWEAVRRARISQVAAAIRRAGLANQKAPRIKTILEAIDRDRGELSLEFLRGLSTEEALDYLGSFPGVGPKTVACVLLFACSKPVLPVDTHVHRVCLRLGLIGPKVNAEKAHAELARLVRPRQVLEFHIQLIRHGRRTCLARRPRCEDCVLLVLCPEGWRRVL